MNDDNMKLIERAYRVLLGVPHTGNAGVWRATHQRIYSDLRDAIANARNVTAEEVQEEFESEVAQS